MSASKNKADLSLLEEEKDKQEMLDLLMMDADDGDENVESPLKSTSPRKEYSIIKPNS
jgi:hypothetical protein